MSDQEKRAPWGDVAFFGCLTVLFVVCWMAGRGWMLYEVMPTVAAMDAPACAHHPR